MALGVQEDKSNACQLRRHPAASPEQYQHCRLPVQCSVIVLGLIFPNFISRAHKKCNTEQIWQIDDKKLCIVAKDG